MEFIPARAARQIKDIENRGEEVYTGLSYEADQGY